MQNIAEMSTNIVEWSDCLTSVREDGVKYETSLRINKSKTSNAVLYSLLSLCLYFVCLEFSHKTFKIVVIVTLFQFKHWSIAVEAQIKQIDTRKKKKIDDVGNMQCALPLSTHIYNNIRFYSFFLPVLFIAQSILWVNTMKSNKMLTGIKAFVSFRSVR